MINHLLIVNKAEKLYFQNLLIGKVVTFFIIVSASKRKSP